MPSILARARAGEIFEDDGFRFKDLLKQYLKIRNGMPSNRGVGYYHPSALSRCARALYYCRIGKIGKENIPMKLRLIFDTGHAIHRQLDDYIDGMLEVGLIQPGQVEYEVNINYPSMPMEGHADCVVYFKNWIIDFKSIGDTGFSRLKQPVIDENGDVQPEGLRDYVWQLHGYMIAENIPRATLFYYNKNSSALREYPVMFNLALWEKIEHKIMMIEDGISEGRAPDREVSKWGCPKCSYYQLCKPGV